MMPSIINSGQVDGLTFYIAPVCMCAQVNVLAEIHTIRPVVFYHVRHSVAHQK